MPRSFQSPGPHVNIVEPPYPQPGESPSPPEVYIFSRPERPSVPELRGTGGGGARGKGREVLGASHRPADAKGPHLLALRAPVRGRGEGAVREARGEECLHSIDPHRPSQTMAPSTWLSAGGKRFPDQRREP